VWLRSKLPARTAAGRRERDSTAGTAGGDLGNVNRWRGQVGQQPVSAEELLKLAQSVVVAGQPATLYEQSGESNRILAVIQHRGDTAWFFKMTGTANS